MTTRTEIKKALLKAFRAEKLVCRINGGEWQKSPWDAGMFKATNKAYWFSVVGEIVIMRAFGWNPVEWKITG